MCQTTDSYREGRVAGDWGGFKFWGVGFFSLSRPPEPTLKFIPWLLRSPETYMSEAAYA